MWQMSCKEAKGVVEKNMGQPLIVLFPTRKMGPYEGKGYGSLYCPFSALISSGTLPRQGSTHVTQTYKRLPEHLDVTIHPLRQDQHRK
jgi:hypothetical protein